jgi:hypothetical protein
LTLPHPASIFWGSDLAIIYNVAWSDAAEASSQQGIGQAICLADQAVAALRKAKEGRTSHTLASHYLLKRKTQTNDSGDDFILLSPLFGSNGVGVVAQILPLQGASLQLDQGEVISKDNGQLHALQDSCTGSDADQEGEQRGILSDAVGNSRKRSDTNQLSFNGQDETIRKEGNLSNALQESRRSNKQDREGDDLGVDDHPFFRKFAHMLPVGLAILNHKAEALFLNTHFNELTEHDGSDKSLRHGLNVFIQMTTAGSWKLTTMHSIQTRYEHLGLYLKQPFVR